MKKKYSDISSIYSQALAKKHEHSNNDEILNLAGYTQKELQNIPKKSVNTSFGCGNPLAFARVKKGDTVLDLGCGSGLDLILAAKKVGPQGKVIGIDMTAKMIQIAQKNVEKSGLKNIEIINGFIENISIESSSVDWVISNCVVNLSSDKSKVFSEIYRVLKPQGYILISDIVINGWIKFVLRATSYFPQKIRKILQLNGISQTTNEKEYVDRLQKAGFKEIKIRERFFYEASQIKTIAKSEGYLGNAGKIKNKLADIVINSISGKVCSINLFAYKNTPRP